MSGSDGAERAPRAMAAFFLALTLMLVATGATHAAPPAPDGLEVEGGEARWHPTRLFGVRWAAPDVTPDGDAARAHLLLRDADGRVVAAEERDLRYRRLQVHVPDRPGEYRLELRLEDGDGQVGPPARARLRFDDARPPGALPLAPTGWIGRDDFPLAVPIDLTGGATPVSGIAGYAISVAPPPGAAPCAASRCAPAEIDAAGPGPASADFPSLPAGRNTLRLAAVSGAGVPSTGVGEAELRVDVTDPATRLSGVPRGWTDRPVRLSALASDSLSGMDGGEARTAIRVGGLPPVAAPGPRAALTVIAEGAHRVAYFARDAAGNSDDGGRGNAEPRTALVRIDRTPPLARFAPARPSDPELIVAEVEDTLSGPDGSRGWIGVRRGGSGKRFQPLPAAPAPAGELRARWDSGAHRPGTYEFRVTAYDAAGNASRSELRGNESRMLLPNPLKATTTLRLGFGGRTMTWQRCARRRGRLRCPRLTIAAFQRRPPELTVPNGRGMRLSGRLVAGTLAPAARMPVHLSERYASGSRVRARTRVVWTDAAGRFSARLASGPSRAVLARFAGNRKLGGSRGKVLRLRVRTGVRMRASAAVARVGGAPLILRGRVASNPGEIPAEGLPVQLQFRLPGLPWSEFRTVGTDRRGHFRYAYSFSDDDSRGARFLFRAFVPRKSDWPYEPGGSRPVAVIGI